MPERAMQAEYVAYLSSSSSSDVASYKSQECRGAEVCILGRQLGARMTSTGLIESISLPGSEQRAAYVCWSVSPPLGKVENLGRPASRVGSRFGSIHVRCLEPVALTGPISLSFPFLWLGVVRVKWAP